MFLAAERGIPHNPEQHAAYVGSWIKTLKQDKNEIFRAAHDVSAATDFLISLERNRSIGDKELAAGPVRSTDAGSSPAAILEEESEVVHRDRERLEETDRDADVASGAIPDLDAAMEREFSSTQLAGSVSKPSDNANERYGSARESTQTVARFEPGSGTVNVHAKQSATDRRTPVHVPVISPTPNGGGKENASTAESLRTARAITKQTLGDSARTPGDVHGR